MAAVPKTIPFHTYWLALTKEQRAELSQRVGHPVSYLAIVASGTNNTRASANVALRIERATNRVCRVEEISPHIEWEILLSRPGLRRKPGRPAKPKK